MMMERLIFAVQQGLTHRQALKGIPFAESITTIDWQCLHQTGVRAVVLDFDGVLAPDNALQIHDDVYDVLKKIKEIFGSHIYILSNKPKEERQAFFALNFPDIQFIIAKKKPYPDGLQEIIAREQCAPQQVILIDDRLLTGGLATILAGAQCLLIKNPYVNFSGNPLREAGFLALRTIERLLFR